MHLKSIRLVSKEAIVHFLMLLILVALLIYTRFVNIGWSLPYPMHPDERNMVDAISQLRCTHVSDIPRLLMREFQITWQGTQDTSSPTVYLGHMPCLQPTFFAYGQVTLYIGLALAKIVSMKMSITNAPLDFGEIALALRIISATASVFTAIVLYKLIRVLYVKKLTRFAIYTSLAGLICVPSAIQFAHYGTTESLLALLYVLSVYWSVQLYHFPKVSFIQVVTLGVVSGLAIGAKLSGVITVGIPLFTLGLRWVEECVRIYGVRRAQLAAYADPPGDTPPSFLTRIALRYSISATIQMMVHVLVLIIATVLVAVISSPYNLISFNEFASSMTYETGVGVGSVIPFYTRQFLLEQPLSFQLVRVLPYALGAMMTLLGIVGFLFVRVRSSAHTIVRFATVLAFVANGFLYAKWTRFLAPMLPLLTLFAILMWLRLIDSAKQLAKSKRPIASYALGLLFCIMIVPGIAFVQIYTSRDVRIAASAWMYDHVPSGSTVLSETANVIDIPIDGPGAVRPSGYNITNISFNFYDLDDSPTLQAELKRHIASADYISVPSRRIFYNHSCRPVGKVVDPDVDPRPLHSLAKCAFLRAKYPALNTYYDDLFSGKLGFVPVARFASYPRLKIFGYTLMEFPDEIAEETSTVFDHPVIRIYGRVGSKPKNGG
ncbi:MAG: hypothetical protein WCJ70_01875 [bacterium]